MLPGALASTNSPKRFFPGATDLGGRSGASGRAPACARARARSTSVVTSSSSLSTARCCCCAFLVRLGRMRPRCGEGAAASCTGDARCFFFPLRRFDFSAAFGLRRRLLAATARARAFDLAIAIAADFSAAIAFSAAASAASAFASISRALCSAKRAATFFLCSRTPTSACFMRKMMSSSIAISSIRIRRRSAFLRFRSSFMRVSWVFFTARYLQTRQDPRRTDTSAMESEGHEAR